LAQTLLKLEDLHTQFFTVRGVVKAVDGVSLHIDVGETLGVVGESGCGKTITALSVLRLVPEPGKIVSGKIEFRGRDVTTARVLAAMTGQEAAEAAATVG